MQPRMAKRNPMVIDYAARHKVAMAGIGFTFGFYIIGDSLGMFERLKPKPIGHPERIKEEIDKQDRTTWSTLRPTVKDFGQHRETENRYLDAFVPKGVKQFSRKLDETIDRQKELNKLSSGTLFGADVIFTRSVDKDKQLKEEQKEQPVNKEQKEQKQK